MQRRNIPTIICCFFQYFFILAHPESIEESALTIVSPAHHLITWKSWGVETLEEGIQKSLKKEYPFSLHVNFDAIQRRVDPAMVEVCTNTTGSSTPLCINLIDALSVGHFPNIEIYFSEYTLKMNLWPKNPTYTFEIFSWLNLKNDNGFEVFALTNQTVFVEYPPLEYNPEDFTIIIQGPLTTIGIQSIPKYLEFAACVIVTCWAEDDLSLILPLLQLYPLSLTLVAQPLPKTPPWNPPRWELVTLYQFTSTLAALRLVSTKFSIKVRSDEYFANLMPFAIKISEVPNRLVSCNVYVLQSRGSLVSDHCFGGNTSLLLTTSHQIVVLLSKYNSQVEAAVFPGKPPHSAEKLLLRSFLQACKLSSGVTLFADDIEDDCRLNSSRTHVDKYLVEDAQSALAVISYVPVSSMKPYHLRCNQRQGMDMRTSVSDEDAPSSIKPGRIEHALLVFHDNVEALLRRVVMGCPPIPIDSAHDDLFHAIHVDRSHLVPHNKMALLQRYLVLEQAGEADSFLWLPFVFYLSLRLAVEFTQLRDVDLAVGYMELAVSTLQDAGAVDTTVLSLLQRLVVQQTGTTEHLSSEEARAILSFLEL